MGSLELPLSLNGMAALIVAVRQRGREADDSSVFVRKLSVGSNQLVSHAGKETDRRQRGRKQEMEQFRFCKQLLCAEYETASLSVRPSIYSPLRCQ